MIFKSIDFRRQAAVFCAVMLFFASFFAFLAADFRALAGSPAANIPAATLNLAISVSQDGLAAVNTTADTLNGRAMCPSNPTAGCDFSLNNNVVRTNDSVIYNYDYNVNGADEDVTLTVVAPLGTTWNVLPAFCNTGSTLTGNGTTTASTILCKRGLKTQGTSDSLPFTATVSGTTAHNTVLTATGSIAGPSSTTVNASAPNVVVTAAPHFNIRKAYQTHAPFTFNGVSGYRIEYRVYVENYDDSAPVAYNPRIGSAQLANPFTFTDVVSGISPNALLQSCAKQSDNGGAGGTITCTQAGGAGTDISASVAGANTTLSQWATPPSDNRFLVGTYQIYVFIPATDVTNAPSQSLNTTNTITNFDPMSADGQSNFGASTEMTTDNAATKAITALTGSFSKGYVKDYNNSNSSSYGVAVGGNRFVAPGEIFASQVSLNNNTGATLNNVVLCDVMDNSKYSVTESAAGSGIVAGNDTPAPTAVEYATGYVNANWMPTTSAGNPTGIRTECSDAGITWYASPTQVPGGTSAITKFRVRYASLAAGAVGTVRVRVKARDNNYYNNQTIAGGAVLPNFAAWRSDELNPTFTSNNYYPNVYPNNASGTFGARLFLARAIARITKETEQNNAVNSVATGGTIGYVLKPTLTTVGTPNPVQVSVMDVLPAGLSYIVGTGQQNNQTFEPQIINCAGNGAPDTHCTFSGQQLLVWTLNNQTPNATIPPISFRAAADLTVLNNQTVTNTAIISSPADPSQEVYRTATRNVTGASPSTLLIFKTTNTPQIEVGDAFRYTVSYRNSSVATDFTGLDFIDVLPFNGDASLNFDTGVHQRSPASAFNGTRALTSLSASTSSAVWYFTNAAPAAVNLNPKYASNVNPGAVGSIWCAGTQAGPSAGCGFTLAQATAVRLLDNVMMPRGNAVRTLTLNFSTAGNQSNDRYTNNASGAASELVLPVSSNNVPIVVLESALSGSVWYDTNADGVRGAEETGRASGVTVTLTGTDNDGNSINRTTTTAANGNYAFAQLTSGNYFVKFDRPANYAASPQDAGADDSNDSDANSATLQTQSISLGINETKSNIDAGFYALKLAGTVWSDVNRNGLLDAAEHGLPNLGVELLDAGGGTLASTQTDGNGNYSFANLAAGDYRVRIATSGVSASPVFMANPNDDVDGDNNGETSGSWSTSRVISLAPGNEPTLDQSTGTTLNSTLDFGLALIPSAAQVAVGGRVLTNEGRGVARAVVTMTDANGTMRQTLTNPFGFYRFAEVPAGGSVTVAVASKSYSFESPAQVVNVSESLTDVNFIAQN